MPRVRALAFLFDARFQGRHLGVGCTLLPGSGRARPWRSFRSARLGHRPRQTRLFRIGAFVTIALGPFRLGVGQIFLTRSNFPCCSASARPCVLSPPPAV